MSRVKDQELIDNISKTANALGLSQCQLNYEVDALFSATIKARTDRMASALGITNSDILCAKATGSLVDFLQGRFSGFVKAMKETD